VRGEDEAVFVARDGVAEPVGARAGADRAVLSRPENGPAMALITVGRENSTLFYLPAADPIVIRRLRRRFLGKRLLDELKRLHRSSSCARPRTVRALA
jgi:hypothetical protein